jgi:hypothetical protein
LLPVSSLAICIFVYTFFYSPSSNLLSSLLCSFQSNPVKKEKKKRKKHSCYLHSLPFVVLSFSRALILRFHKTDSYWYMWKHICVVVRAVLPPLLALLFCYPHSLSSLTLAESYSRFFFLRKKQQKQNPSPLPRSTSQIISYWLPLCYRSLLPSSCSFCLFVFCLFVCFALIACFCLGSVLLFFSLPIYMTGCALREYLVLEVFVCLFVVVLICSV